MGSEHRAAKIHPLYACDSEWRMSGDLCQGDGIGREGQFTDKSCSCRPPWSDKALFLKEFAFLDSDWAVMKRLGRWQMTVLRWRYFIHGATVFHSILTGACWTHMHARPHTHLSNCFIWLPCPCPQGSFRGHLATSPQQSSSRRRTNENAVLHFFRGLVSFPFMDLSVLTLHISSHHTLHVCVSHASNHKVTYFFCIMLTNILSNPVSHNPEQKKNLI